MEHRGSEGRRKPRGDRLPSVSDTPIRKLDKATVSQTAPEAERAIAGRRIHGEFELPATADMTPNKPKKPETVEGGCKNTDKQPPYEKREATETAPSTQPDATPGPLPRFANDDPLSPRADHNRDLILVTRLGEAGVRFSQGLMQWIRTYLRLQEYNISGNENALLPSDRQVLDMAAQLPHFQPPMTKRPAEAALPTPKRRCDKQDEPSPTLPGPSRPAEIGGTSVLPPTPPTPPPPPPPATSTEQPATSAAYSQVARMTPPQAQPARDQPAPAAKTRKERYPPVIAEKLPNWSKHLAEIARKLGRTPVAAPCGDGVRFMPRDGDEYRVVADHLRKANMEDPSVVWHFFTPKKEINMKVCIRGLPPSTDLDELKEALRGKGYEAAYAKCIRARSGRPGCIFFAELSGTPEENAGIYGVRELLYMSGIKIEAWRGKQGPAQCHRCQAFRHSSQCCFRPIACVRCGGPHAAKECTRPREEPATCANCGGPHPANHTGCPEFRREARNKKAGTQARTRPTSSNRTGVRPTTSAQVEGDPAAETLMARGNDPKPRGEGGPHPKPGPVPRKKRPRRRKKPTRTEGKGDPSEKAAAATSADVPQSSGLDLLAILDLLRSAIVSQQTGKQATPASKEPQ